MPLEVGKRSFRNGNVYDNLYEKNCMPAMFVPASTLRDTRFVQMSDGLC